MAIVGWPNVGKSTLLNALVGTKLSIVSPRPQTTRETIVGIFNDKDVQAIFLDTPGWLKPGDHFQSLMKRAVVRSIHDDADVVIWVLEPQKTDPEHRAFGEKLRSTNKPICVAINKCDLAVEEDLIDELNGMIRPCLPDNAVVRRISSRTGMGVNELKADLVSKLPLSPPYYPLDQVTDRWERFYVAELIREQIFRRFQQEVPYASAVLIEEFIEKKDRKDLIKAAIVVETEGQMKIIIGEKGRSIRDLGKACREEIESRLGRPVYLEMKVKVRRNWRGDGQFLKGLQEINR